MPLAHATAATHAYDWQHTDTLKRFLKALPYSDAWIPVDNLSISCNALPERGGRVRTPPCGRSQA